MQAAINYVPTLCCIPMLALPRLAVLGDTDTYITCRLLDILSKTNALEPVSLVNYHFFMPNNQYGGVLW